MSSKRGVITERKSTSARPISVTSTLPLAFVFTSNVQSGLYCFDSPKDALEYFKDKHTNGNLTKYIKLGVDKFPLIVPTIISIANEVVEEEGVKTAEEAAAETKSNIINATNILKSSTTSTNLADEKGSMIGYKADIVGVADYASNDDDIKNTLIATTEYMKARTFIDLDASTNGDAISQRDKIGSDRVTVIKTPVIDWNVDTDSQEFYDSGVMACYLRSYVDGSSKIGYSKSISNRVIPFSGVKNPSEFIAGAQDETDPLTEKQIMSFISYMGLRTWEYSTCSADAIWQDARRVRIFDLAADAVLEGIFFAVDKDMGALTSAKKSLRGFMDGLVGDEVMLGFDVYLDEERTTPERITAGEFYFVIDAQEMPSPKLICVTFNRVDRYAPLVYKMIEEAA